MNAKTAKKPSHVRRVAIGLFALGGWFAAIACGMALGQSRADLAKLQKDLTPPPLPAQGDALSLSPDDPRRLAQDFVAQAVTSVGDASYTPDRRVATVNVTLRPIQAAQACSVKVVYAASVGTGSTPAAWHVVTHDCR